MSINRLFSVTYWLKRYEWRRFCSTHVMSSKSLYVVNTPNDADELDRALDHIESRMTSSAAVAPALDQRELVMTPEELRQIVSTAVTEAIAAYERARAAKAGQARPATPALRLMPGMAKLQDEMGLGDLEFDNADAAPVAVAELSNEAKEFVYQDPTEAALTAWDDALKRLSSDNGTDDKPRED